MNARTFSDSPAIRATVPILVGVCGPSGGGKTFSALRLAAGMQREVGGDIFGIDSEANRMLHYADDFKFRHVPLGAPFSPADYGAAIRHCVERGARHVVVDSGSHMHEGIGGLLQEHDRLLAAKGGDLRHSMSCWIQPKRDLKQFIDGILQLRINLIFCFRAREKLKLVQGKDPVPLGYMPIIADELLFEMTLNCLLYPNSKGVPSWQPDEMGERAIVKLPRQFVELFKERRALDENHGAALARWAAGGQAVAGTQAAAPAPAHAPAEPPSASDPRNELIARLAEILTGNGIRDQKARISWVERMARKNAANVTADELRGLIRRAEEGEMP
jgi:hypothetical protein